MASIVSKITPGGQSGVPSGGPGQLLQMLQKWVHILAFISRDDDPVCLSALDETTLGRYGYSENQIHLMKEGALR